MDGKHQYSADEYPYEELRMWRLCTMMRCRPSDVENESAVKLDWLLAVDDEIAAYKAEMQRKAHENGG